MSRDIIKISVSDIKAGKYRLRDSLPVIEELTESIRERGLLEPIGVVRTGKGYDLCYGERRLASCKNLRWKTIPATIFDRAEHALLAGFTENLQRRDLTPLEEARALERILATGMTQAALAKAIGKTQSYIAQKLRLEKLPCGVTALMSGKKPAVTEGHARQLLRLVQLMNPDICAPAYSQDFRMRTEVETNREAERLEKMHNGALDAVTYYQNRLAWRHILGKKLSVRELETRINYYSRTLCLWCLQCEPGHCIGCRTGGRGFEIARYRIKLDAGVVPEADEIKASADLIASYMSDED